MEYVPEKYYIGIPYDLLGILELVKVNKKSITCLDSLDNKVYLTEEILNKLYIPDDGLLVSMLHTNYKQLHYQILYLKF